MLSVVRALSSSSSDSSNAAAAAFSALVNGRVSARSFLPDQPPIPSSTLRGILQDTLRSPSSFNLQPFQVVLVTSPSSKASLSEHAMLGGNKSRVKDSQLTAVFLKDLKPSKRLPRVLEVEDTSRARHDDYLAVLPLASAYFSGEQAASSSSSSSDDPSSSLKSLALGLLSTHLKSVPSSPQLHCWTSKNVGLAAMTFVYACESRGYSTCVMEGYDGRRVLKCLDVDDEAGRWDVPLCVAVGTAREIDKKEQMEGGNKRTGRLEVGEVFFMDKFGKSFEE